MPNIYKANVVATLRERFGHLQKIPGSEIKASKARGKSQWLDHRAEYDFPMAGVINCHS